MRKIGTIVLGVALAMTLVFGLAACAYDEGEGQPGGPGNQNGGENRPMTEQNPVVTMVVEDFGTITIELLPDEAPQTVDNFIYLINQGFYDGSTFHRIIRNFMIQGGCPEGTGMSGPGYTILGEFSQNGIENNISHERGVISMARVGNNPNSGGSQFFIVDHDTNARHLDGVHAAFGRVIEGMDIVDEIANVRTSGDSPVSPPVIERMTVETFGVEFPEPEKLR